MLYYWLFPYAEQFGLLNLFQYLTFRSGGALLTALVLSFVIGPRMIRWLKVKQGKGQPIREDGPAQHLLTKKGTPTMGGLMMLLSLTLSTLLWMELSNPFVWIVLGVTLGYGALGFWDDFLKVTKRNTKGFAGRYKILLEFAIAGVAVLAIQYATPHGLREHLAVPFFKDVLVDLGWFYVMFAMLVVVGASNAVNLTDGLDGLAIVPIMLVAGTLGFVAYVAGNVVYAEYLQIHRISGAGELAVLCAALIGSGLGFLWYNAPPARVFMGDTGSLAFGGSLGTIAVITKHEMVLAIAGGLFVAEAMSVIIQVVSFKTTGKRVFKMAPVHHHFEKMGWQEPTIVIRFWIITVVLCLLALSTLKLR